MGKTDLGIVRISNDAVAMIASVAAMEVKGVLRMGSKLPGAMFDIFLNRFSSKGVRIETRDSEIKLTIWIVVEYGVDISRVADEAQENVKRAVEKMAGLVPAEVDVIVEGVALRTAGQKERKL